MKAGPREGAEARQEVAREWRGEMEGGATKLPMERCTSSRSFPLFVSFSPLKESLQTQCGTVRNPPAATPVCLSCFFVFFFYSSLGRVRARRDQHHYTTATTAHSNDIEKRQRTRTTTARTVRRRRRPIYRCGTSLTPQPATH